MYKRLLSAALIFGAAALAPPANAQQMRCLPRVDLVNTLEGKYGESLAGGGLQSQQSLLEIWASSETGSFTVFVTRPDGVSCIVATGHHWNASTPAESEGISS